MSEGTIHTHTHTKTCTQTHYFRMTHRFPVASKFPWVDFGGVGGGGFRGVATLPNGQNHSVKCIYIGKRLVVARVYVTLHEKTMHNALTIDFELRLPFPTTTFELLILQI